MSPDSTYRWTQLVTHAPWKESYNFQMITWRDTLWTLHPDGNWWSVDGQQWQLSPLGNALNNLAFLDYILMRDTLYALGNFEGNIAQFTWRPQVHYSADGRHWRLASGEQQLPRRFFYHPFVFQDRLWIIGGEDEHQQYDDVWSSGNGQEWRRDVAHADFGKRSSSQTVWFRNKLWLLNNDVWSSTDGIHWQLESREIVPGETIFGYTAVVWNDRIWLLGCNRNGQFSSQVLSSQDGKNWTAHAAPWTPRGGIAAAVYRGHLYMTGGKYGGTPHHPDFRYSNDVWILSSSD